MGVVVAGAGVTPSASHSTSTTWPLSPSRPRGSPLTVASTPPPLPQRKEMLSRPLQVRVVPSSREPTKTSSPSTTTRNQEYSTMFSSTSTPTETLGLGVPVGALVPVGVLVLVGTVVGVEADTTAGVTVGMAVDVAVGMAVGMAVGVAVGMAVGTAVGVVASVAVEVAGGSMISSEVVAVGDGVAVATARHDDNRVLTVGAR